MQVPNGTGPGVRKSRKSQITRCRVTATFWRPQIKQYTVSNDGAVQNQRIHHVILTKYEAVYLTVVSGIVKVLMKVQKEYI